MDTLSPSQQEAADAFLEFLKDPSKKEFLLSGFAGSGKTYLLHHLVGVVQKLEGCKIWQYHFTATTNKAASVLGDMLGRDASTIHSALGLTLKYDYNTGEEYLEPTNDPVNLENSLLVIDEGSMINKELLFWIRDTAGCANHCKILYVGDSYQLPPVNEGICPIFEEIEDAHFLTDIQRQAAESNIISFSNEYRLKLDSINAINDLILLDYSPYEYKAKVDELTVPWPEIPNNGVDIMHYSESDAWGDALEAAYKSDHGPDDLRVLAWTNDIVHRYNNYIRRQIIGYKEPFEPDEILIANNAVVMDRQLIVRIGDMYRVKSATKHKEHGIDGYMLSLTPVAGGGHLRLFQPSNPKAKKRVLDNMASVARSRKGRDRSNKWKEFYDTRDGWGDFRALHSMTVHKSQGSTYKEVFIDMEDIGKNKIQSELARLMYVAATRASDKIHLFGHV
jgi:exodeoxyribonuclease-5